MVHAYYVSYLSGILKGKIGALIIRGSYRNPYNLVPGFEFDGVLYSVKTYIEVRTNVLLEASQIRL